MIVAARVDGSAWWGEEWEQNDPEQQGGAQRYVCPLRLLVTREVKVLSLPKASLMVKAVTGALADSAVMSSSLEPRVVEGSPLFSGPGRRGRGRLAPGQWQRHGWRQSADSVLSTGQASRCLQS